MRLTSSEVIRPDLLSSSSGRGFDIGTASALKKRCKITCKKAVPDGL